MATPQPAPGWYPEPGGSEGERYWDGERWTTQRRITPSPNDPVQAPPNWYDDPDGSGGERYWSGQHWTTQRRPKADATVNPPGSQPTWHPTAKPSQPQPDRRVWESSAPRVHAEIVVEGVGVEVDGAGQATAAGRLEAVRRTTMAWTGQLVDLTGRNSLLYYRDLKVGTLPLDSSPRQLIYNVLAGRPGL